MTEEKKTLVENGVEGEAAGVAAAGGPGEPPPADEGVVKDQGPAPGEAAAGGEGRGLEEMQASLDKARAELAEATGRYKELVLALHPDIPAELISGASIGEIDASVQKASALVEKIRASILRRSNPPAGTPARSAPDWSALSPRDKIKAGIGRSRQ